jgi:hypothetical protein
MHGNTAKVVKINSKPFMRQIAKRKGTEETLGGTVLGR